MALFMAKSIIDGRDYAKLFSFAPYQRYQEEVDIILIAEGREDLIAR